MKKSQKNGFTMIEIVVVLVIISSSLIAIISGITTTIRYVSEIRQRTIALSLAKEGIEAVYNIRNTNWRRRSANRDACWLKANPMVDEGNDGCENDTWMHKDGWILDFNPFTQNKQQSYSLIHWKEYGSLRLPEKKTPFPYGTLTDSNPTHKQHRKHLVNGERISDYEFERLKNLTPSIKESFKEGKYYHAIIIQGTYDKNGPTSALSCKNGTNNTCGDSSAKELRFCSRVVYTIPHQGVVNICAVMTNYLE